MFRFVCLKWERKLTLRLTAARKCTSLSPLWHRVVYMLCVVLGAEWTPLQNKFCHHMKSFTSCATITHLTLNWFCRYYLFVHLHFPFCCTPILYWHLRLLENLLPYFLSVCHTWTLRQLEPLCNSISST
ncbi:hypothetical protein TRVL_00772 [Trypanosoma vivax]|uniref:Uncharacterized protein n=1 Tax=Trypanosoma vivax (strain Y486) TaxID=1055687 RepID=G0U104_TRYVY|nr:hypothetical protein TRVL_00772 [Trypanosoma vivax]CCC49759.1 hypothetical protein TVY486_0803670 [Trypanosoma vivax Y486]